MKIKLSKKQIVKLITALVIVVAISTIMMIYPNEVIKLLLDSARNTLPSPVNPMLWKYIQ